VADTLPLFVRPMLARLGQPFDSPEHIFEIKWDGIRALAFAATGSTRLRSRGNRPLDGRFPELSFLDTLERGLVLDGEIVAFKDGRPELSLVLSRSRTDRPEGAAYMVFDLLYQGFEPTIDLPVEERRDRLRALVRRAGHPGLLFSDSVSAAGRQLFVEACRSGLEGVVAKRLGSRYLPGRRSDAWVKIKQTQRMYCVVIGFLPSAERDFQSLVLASDDRTGSLGYVGTVGTGFAAADRERVVGYLRRNLRTAPVVPCPLNARWVEPGLFCLVEFSELTPNGLLRSPVFKEVAQR
jgi:DNA ligase D-like protein (predicted ligase)